MNAIGNRPFRFLLVTTAIGTGILAAGAGIVAIITTLMMYYHLQNTPISPVEEQSVLASPVFLWIILALLTIVEITLIRWLRRNWVARREHRKRNAA